MKRTVKVKNLISFAAVLILLFSIAAVPAYAEFPPLTTGGRRLGAWLLSALTAMNISLTSTLSASQGADIINFLADPLDLTYSYTEMWNDRPTIQIWDDYVTIDGVTYTDIWLSNEAATKFKTDGNDFKTAYSIASNTNGTFAEGVGFIEGLPIFNINNVKRTQSVSIPYNSSSTPARYSYGNGYLTSNSYRIITYFYSNGGQGASTGQIPSASFPYDTYFKVDPNTRQYCISNQNRWSGLPASYSSTPFDFDYVAGTIDTAPLEPDEGLMMRIPSNQIPGIQQFITDNPEFAEPGGTTVDVTVDPDIMNKLDDLIDIIAPIIPIITSFGDVQFTVNHTEPTPPIPDTPIVDATVPQVVQPIINEIQNQGDIISQTVPPIIESIPKIDEICNNIDTAPYHDLDTGLDRLPSFFLPFITDLRSALGIWHYVTEWLAQISTTFAFVSGCLVGTSIMTPIYAAIAGFMCIKIYRRMTA